MKPTKVIWPSRLASGYWCWWIDYPHFLTNCYSFMLIIMGVSALSLHYSAWVISFGWLCMGKLRFCLACVLSNRCSVCTLEFQLLRSMTSEAAVHCWRYLRGNSVLHIHEVSLVIKCDLHNGRTRNIFLLLEFRHKVIFRAVKGDGHCDVIRAHNSTMDISEIMSLFQKIRPHSDIFILYRCRPIEWRYNDKRHSSNDTTPADLVEKILLLNRPGHAQVEYCNYS